MKIIQKPSKTAYSKFKHAILKNLSAPFHLMLGSFSKLPTRHISTFDDAWMDVGQLIRSSAENYRGFDVRK